MGKHHAHTAKHFLSIKRTGIEYYIAGESHFYLKPNEILKKRENLLFIPGIPGF